MNIDTEHYALTWVGKTEAKKIAQTPSMGTLRPCPEDSKNWDTTQNLYIEGDNLEVLKLLQKSYHKKVKMVYIDPPYNTRNKFVYNDNFRNHSNWLNMMYPRIELARNLLRDDGMIFISIDDNEVHNLRLLCDEIFGEKNFVGQIMTIANPGGRDYNQIAVTHEYLLVYKKTDSSELNEISKDITFKLEDNNGGYEIRELRNRNPKFNSLNRPNLFYPFYVNPNLQDKYGQCAVSLTKTENFIVEVKPYNSVGKESVWRWGRAKSNEHIVPSDPHKSQIVAKQKRDGGWNIYEKTRRTTTKIKSIWDETEMRTENGTRLVRLLFNETLFDHPKSLELIKRICEVGSNENDIILDFFSGSATTAHAVMKLNSEDDGNRKFICVQLPETTDEKSEAFKAGYKNICEIGKERIRRAGDKIIADSPNKDLSGLDTGFKVFKIS
jgi:adenine specific DNA methylase Mod